MDGDAGPDFTSWVLARRGSLLRTAWLLTLEDGSAEDLVQNALLHCWRRWPRVRKMGDIDGYVRKIMTNSYLSDRRRRWSSEVPTEFLPDSPASSRNDLDDRAQLVASLARLPRGQRAVVVLRFAEDLSVDQAAAVAGCSAGTVKSQTSRALATLRVDGDLVPEDWT